jgi:hypothetical protein
MKLLQFADGGSWLYYHLLEAGTFEPLKAREASCQSQLDATELSMLLAGVSLERAGKRWNDMQPELAMIYARTRDLCSC